MKSTRLMSSAMVAALLLSGGTVYASDNNNGNLWVHSPLGWRAFGAEATTDAKGGCYKTKTKDNSQFNDSPYLVSYCEPSQTYFQEFGIWTTTVQLVKADSNGNDSSDQCVSFVTMQCTLVYTQNDSLAAVNNCNAKGATTPTIASSGDTCSLSSAQAGNSSGSNSSNYYVTYE